MPCREMPADSGGCLPCIYAIRTALPFSVPSQRIPSNLARLPGCCSHSLLASRPSAHLCSHPFLDQSPLCKHECAVVCVRSKAGWSVRPESQEGSSVRFPLLVLLLTVVLVPLPFVPFLLCSALWRLHARAQHLHLMLAHAHHGTSQRSPATCCNIAR